VKKKNKIRNLLINLNSKNNNRIKLFFINNKNKSGIKIQKKTLYVFYGNKKLILFAKFYFSLIFANTRFDFNPFLLFKINNILFGHNILPDWTGNYLKQKFITNIFSWLKKLFYIILFKKRLLLISIKTF
jgi:hypothetical protein